MSNPNQNNQNEHAIVNRLPDYQDEEIDLREYLNVILEARWLVLGITAAVFALGFLYTMSAVPSYRSDALLQVEDIQPTVSGIEDISSMLPGNIPIVTEIEIIRSRSIIGAAIDQLDLAIVAKPKHFPIFGANSARKHKTPESLANPVWGLGSYAWGGERIKVERLDMSPSMEGKTLTLLAGKEGSYELIGPDGEMLLKGSQNKLVERKNEDDPYVSIYITDLLAREGTRFELKRIPRARMIEALQSQLSIKEKGNNSGILEIALQGEDPKLTAKILNSIANTYLRQNVERKSVEIERTLEFLNKQLPDLKSTLNQAETRLNSYRATSGKIDLTLETQAILRKSTEIEGNIQKLQLEKTKLRQRFTGNHPSILGIKKQIVNLIKEKNRQDAEIKKLPETEQESVRLTRDVKVANELYLLLLKKAQELKVIKAGTVGNVRILDAAIIPDNPVSQKKNLTLIMALIAGGLLAIFSVFIRRFLFHGLEDPNEIENKFGIPAYANILHSHTQVRLEKHVKHNKLDTLPVLASEAGDDMTIEALRSLRTSLQFALMKNKKNVIVFGGPAASIGKSFISVNFSHVLADTGKKILLIDGDMRKGHLHRYFSLDKGDGLSEVLSGTLELESAIHETSHENVFFLSSGITPPNPSELLTDDRFSKLVNSVGEKYDLVVIDTPPILDVTDAVIISRIAGIFFLILESRKHHAGEIEQSLKRMEHNGVRPQGIIMNNVRSSSTSYGYGGYRYSDHKAKLMT